LQYEWGVYAPVDVLAPLDDRRVLERNFVETDGASASALAVSITRHVFLFMDHHVSGRADADTSAK
jgi:hypothetical protein